MFAPYNMAEQKCPVAENGWIHEKVGFIANTKEAPNQVSVCFDCNLETTICAVEKRAHFRLRGNSFPFYVQRQTQK